jgi:hypothetical protein
MNFVWKIIHVCFIIKDKVHTYDCGLFCTNDWTACQVVHGYFYILKKVFLNCFFKANKALFAGKAALNCYAEILRADW